jgi:hypothetical protein
VPRLRFDQDDVRFELGRVRCGLPTTQELSVRCPPANFRIADDWARSDRDGRNMVSDDGCAGDAASYGPKTGLVLNEPIG